MTSEVGLIVGKVSAFDIDALDSRIRELVAYARERDGEDRTTLFRSLIDMFLTGKAPVKQPTRGQLLEVIEALIPHVDTEARRTVAEILASMAKPPMDLVLTLARDRAKLIEELLTHAPFDEDDIIDLIETTGRDHHQIIATRSDLSANVWIALARAAPAAPPFERQSSLALWRDDLGTQKEGDVSAEPMAAVAGGGYSGPREVVCPVVTPFVGKGDALKNPGDEGKTSSLRILRTDEDLIAERVGDRHDEPETRMVQADDPTVDEAQPSASATTPEWAPNPEQAPKSEQTSSDAATLHSPLDVSITPAVDAPPLRDPGPGGWAWRSDRDGFVTNISPTAARLFGSSEALVGSAMLDMLGLNVKLGHPVSRAFQRRSTIHDAPINLLSLPEGHQYWTLEAAPVFSPCGGVFEGYEGILTPVVAGNDDIDNHEEDAPLFLDDDPSDLGYRPSFASRATSKPSEPLDMDHDRSRQSNDKTPGTPQPPEANPFADLIQSTAASMVQEAVSKALQPQGRVAAPDNDQPADAVPHKKQQPSETTKTGWADERGPDQPMQSDNQDVQSTLSLLDEALQRLSEAAHQGATAQIRLHSEIAMACMRTLKDQLSNKS